MTSGTISNSYATGFISGIGAGRGGLIGSTSAAHVGSFWDVSGTGQTTSTGGTGVGMTTTQLQTQANFTSSTSANKNNNPAWDLSNTWIMYDGLTMPLLRSFLTPLSVSASNVNKTYDGASYTGNSGVSYSSGSAPTGNLGGTLAYGGTALGASNTGSYAINLSGLYSNQLGYLINYVPGTLSVAPAPVSISGVRAYDGTNALAASIFSLSGLVKDQDLTISGTGSMANQNVGISKTVSLDTLALRNGNTGLSSNYTFVGGVNQVRVNAAALTITAGIIDKTYDGTLAATGTGNVTSGRLYGLDTLSISGLSFTDKNVGSENKIVTANGVSVLDGNGGNNYNVTYVSNNTSSVTPRALIIAAQATDKVYDGTITATVSLTDNRVTGDELALSLNPSLSGSATFANKNVAVNKTVFVSGIQVQGADAGNYTANTTAISTASITPKALTGLVVGQDKVYDGTSTGALVLSSSGVVNGDNLLMAGNGTFANANAGTSKTVEVTGITVTGVDAGNYSLANTTISTTGNITPKIITVLAIGTDKTYDGTTSDVVSLISNGVLAQDISNVQFNALSTFTNKNVGVGKAVVVSNINVTGSSSENYKLSNTSAKAYATITAKKITVTAAGSSKVYDGNTSDVVILSSDGVISGDSVKFSNNYAVFGDKNVGTDKVVTVSGIWLYGTDAQNYSYNANTVTSGSGSASITRKGLTVLAVGQNKVYDGNTTDVVSLSSTGVVKGDNLFLAGSGAFANANAGTSKTVEVTGITVTGVDAGNYSLANTSASTNASITPKIITVVASGTNKEYDGNTSDVVILSSSGVLAQDLSNVQLSGTGTFSTKNVGIGKALAVTNISASGTASNNYQVKNTTAMANATVTAKNLTVIASGADKVYDGSTADAVILSSGGVISGDTVNFASQGAVFGDKNVGTAKTVTVSGISLTGTDAKNYTSNASASSSANITAKGLTVLAVGQNKVYDGNTTDVVSLSSTGVVKGDNLLLAGSGAFTNANAGTAKTVNVTGITITGSDVGNYSLNSTTANTTASIAQKVITVQAIGADKIYDGTTSDVVSLNSSGVLAQDMGNVQFNAASAFATKNVGVGKDVAVSNITANGSASGNYKLGNSSTTAYATVTAKNLTVTAAGISKTYDGTTKDDVTLSSNGVVSGDTVKFASSSAVFSDKNVGDGKVVTVSGISLSGADAKNYSYNANAVTSGSGNASITVKNIAVTAIGSDKVYDGTTTDGVSLASSGIVAGDSVRFTNTAATLDSKNVGVDKAVTVSGIAAFGTDASNYSVSNTTAMTKATVTPLWISVVATGSNKNFDGTTSDAVTLQTNGMITGDSLSFASTSAKFASSAVGVNKVVTVSGVSTLGADAANYVVINKRVTTMATIK
jgi:hypothetical protein